MNVRLLIDGIVRQTTVLIAELSTTAGVRAPLAHVADQVFLDLAQEIEAQGVGRKVAADMFGIALRTYQKKIRRLAESNTEANRTLWQSVLDFLRSGPTTRAHVAERFARDGDREVGAVLSDLVSNGLVYCTGRGDAALYGITSDADLHTVVAAGDVRSVANVAWLHVFLGEAKTELDLVERLGVEQSVVYGATAVLVRDGRLRRIADGTLEAKNIVIPVGASEGWEAAVLDHFRAAATAIAAKAAAGSASSVADEIGGGTLRFVVYPGHPRQEEVRRLLREVRARVGALWQSVADYNSEHPPPEDAPTVSFYFGQTITEPDEARETSNEGGPT